MTIASEITKLNTNLTNSYTACNNKGATMPTNQNFDNLATCIGSIQTGTTPTLITKNITQNGTYNASSDNADGYSSVTVNVPTVTPTGTISINSNGTYDVTNYASADVNVSGGGSYPIGNYYIMNDDNIQPIYFNSATINTVSYTNVCLTTDFTSMNGTERGVMYRHPYYSGGDYSQGLLGEIKNIVMNPTNDPIDSREVKHINLNGITGLVSINGSNKVFQNYFTSLKSVDLSRATSCKLTSGFFGASMLESVDLSSLSDLSTSFALGGSVAIGGAFAYTAVKTLSFPSLNSNSFGTRTNQFNQMLKGVTGCTVHFPSNLQSVIGSWSSVTSGFSGANTTVLFDLPATT